MKAPQCRTLGRAMLLLGHVLERELSLNLTREPIERTPVKNQKSVPEHVAIIMDGNGRWAQNRGLHRSEGHAEGARAVREAVRTSREAGVRYLTLYAFSVANWSRPRPEVTALMRLLADFADREREELREKGIRLNVIGDLEELPTFARRAVDDA